MACVPPVHSTSNEVAIPNGHDPIYKGGWSVFKLARPKLQNKDLKLLPYSSFSEINLPN